MNAIHEAINNLDLMSITLEKVANKPEHYNSEYGGYLEVISWELHRHANDLRSLVDWEVA
jgi:hypothetical protein